MDALSDALLRGATPTELESAELPTEYLAAHTRIEDVDMFRGMEDKDVRQSLRVGPVPMPELAPDEALVAVMASSINYNTVWSATFEPVPTFQFLRRYGKQGGWAARNDQPFHVLGSDAAGVIVRVGVGVRRWKVGDHVVINPIHADDQDPATHADSVLSNEQRAWGYETNYGGLAHYAVVRASMLLAKAPHLTWEEAACVTLCAGTSYRMLVSDKGARMKQGDVVLIWGAAGGLGTFAVQFVKNGGGVAIGVVSSEEKAKAMKRMGCDVVVNRTEACIDTAGDDPREALECGKRLGRIIRREVGEDPHIAFDYVGRATFGMSVLVVRRGGTVITCGSSTGYVHQYDNRYLWMNLKRVIGSHAANAHEQYESNRLLTMGRIVPSLSAVYPLAEVGEAARLVQNNGHVGKVGVLCLAPREGLGVTDPGLRERIGVDTLNPLRNT